MLIWVKRGTIRSGKIRKLNGFCSLIKFVLPYLSSRSRNPCFFGGAQKHCCCIVQYRAHSQNRTEVDTIARPSQPPAAVVVVAKVTGLRSIGVPGSHCTIEWVIQRTSRKIRPLHALRPRTVRALSASCSSERANPDLSRFFACFSSQSIIHHATSRTYLLLRQWLWVHK